MSFPCKGECSRNFFDPITHELIHNTDFINDLCFGEVQEVCRHINCPLEYDCGESMSGADDLQDHGCLEALEALFVAQCIDTTTPAPTTLCCPELEMQGLPHGIQNKREGVFRKIIGVEAYGRPVYQNDFEEFLYYFPNEMDWVVGRNYSGTIAGIASVENRAGCPETFTQWSYFDQGQWHFDHRITISCRQLRPSKWKESGMFSSKEDSAVTMAIFGVAAAVLFMGIFFLFRIISTYFFGKATLLQSSRAAANRLYPEPKHYHKVLHPPPQPYHTHRIHETTPYGTYTPPPPWMRYPVRTPHNTPTSSIPPYFDPTQGFSQHQGVTRSRTQSRLQHQRRSNTRFHPDPFNNPHDRVSGYHHHSPYYRMEPSWMNDGYFLQPSSSSMYYPSRHSTYRPLNHTVRPVQSEVSWTCGPSLGGDEILSEQSVRIQDDSEDMSRICNETPPVPPSRKSTRGKNRERTDTRPLYHDV